MSAQPDIMPASYDHRDQVIASQLARLEEDQHIIRGLRKQNERLKEELLNAQLEASLEIAKAKFGQAQAFQRITELEKRIEAVENESDRINNFVAGHCVQRAEFEVAVQKIGQVGRDFYAHSAGQ